MPRFLPRFRQAGGALAALLASGALAASPLLWQHSLDGPSRERLDIDYAEPLPEGGYRLIGGVIGSAFEGGQGTYGVYQDFDANDRPRGPPRFGPPPRLRTRGSSVDNVALPLEPRVFSLDLRALPPRPCLRSALGGGREMRVVEREEQLLSYQSGGLDGEDGAFAANAMVQGSSPRLQRLYRQQADCSLQLVGDFPYRFDSLRNSSREAAVFAMTEDATGEPAVLRYFDFHGERWMRRPELEGDRARELQSLRELEGDLLVNVVGERSAALRRLDAQGAVRWETRLPQPFLFGSSLPTTRGLLLANRRESSHPSAEVEVLLLDPASGALRWSYRGEPASSVRLIASADPGSARHLFASHQVLQQRLLELDGEGGAVERGELPGQAEPLLQLEDGRLLAASGHRFAGGSALEVPGRRLIRVQPEAARADAAGEAVELEWVPRPLALRADGEGSLLLQWQDGRYAFEALDEAGRLRWRTQLPALTLQGAPGIDPEWSLRQAGRYVCLVLRRQTLSVTARPERSLSCLDRHDGRVLLLQADLYRAQDGEALPRTLRDAGDDSVQLVVLAVASCPVPTNCPRSLQRIDVAADGSTRWTPLGEALPPARLDALALLGDGRVLASAWTGQQNAPRRLQAIDADGQAVELAVLDSAVPQQLPSAQSLADGTVLLLHAGSSPGRSALRLLDHSGGTLRSFEFDGDFEGSVSASLAGAGVAGFAIPVRGADGAVQVNLHTRDGSRRWTRRLGGTETEQLQGLHLEPGGAVRVATLRGQRLLLQRLAAADGLPERAEVIALAGPLRLPLHWTAEGDAMVLSEGAQAYAAAPQPAQLQRLQMREPGGCGSPLPAGFWHDPGSSGQGLFLHPTANGQMLTGVWLSFTLAGDTRRADQRWLSLFGEATRTEPLVLTVQSSRGGSFAERPASESEAVGDVSLQQVRCDLLTLDYRFEAGEFNGHAGRTYLLPTSADSARTYAGGIWYAPETSGQGVMLQLLELPHGRQRLVGAWASFDPEGAADDPTAQHWFTLEGEQTDAGAFEVGIQRTIGGRFDGRATANHLRVGSASLRFEACDRLLLSYRFEGYGAAEFSGLQGELKLRRLDGCAGSSGRHVISH